MDSTAAPSDHTGPDHQHLEGQPYSIFGEDKEMREKRASVILILKARDPLLTSTCTSKGELSESYFSGSFLAESPHLRDVDGILFTNVSLSGLVSVYLTDLQSHFDL